MCVFDSTNAGCAYKEADKRLRICPNHLSYTKDFNQINKS